MMTEIAGAGSTGMGVRSQIKVKVEVELKDCVPPVPVVQAVPTV
jgi:hypothetical protein